LNLVRRDGFGFGFDPEACDTCPGNCCIGTAGFIWVSGAEIQGISEFLGQRTDDFKQDYVRQIGLKFYLKELAVRGSLHCVFFDDEAKRCSIYSVRPEQCRTFPFWEHFKKQVEEVMAECPGVVDASSGGKLQRF
jgi:Fe-S-cluster containining protein